MKSFAIIHKHDGWVKVPADDIEILGFRCKIHRSLKSEKTWSVSDARSGKAFALGATSQKLAIQETKIRILNHGTDKITEFLAREESAPADAPLYVWPQVQKGLDADEVARVIAGAAGLDEEGHKAVRRALCGKGKNAGRLLGKCPPTFKDELACAAWSGIQPNAFKVGIGRLFYLRGAALELFEKLQAKNWPLWLDSDADALDRLGVW